MAEQELTLRTKIEKRNPNDLKLLDVNARFMRKEQYDILVANVKRDGGLTSVPLVWRDPETGVEEVLSGNHRTMAARDAGFTEIDVMLIEQPLSAQQRTAIQLSHNAIVGEDDPATLRVLYEFLDDVDMRAYSGLDDKALDLLDETTVAPMSEANLDYQSMLMVFLPHELEAAREAFDEARRRVSGGADVFMAGMAQYEPVLDALETAHSAANVTNVAAALSVILMVFEDNLDALQEWWADENGNPKHKGNGAPMETVFGTRVVKQDVASTILKALKEARKRGDMGKAGDPWEFMQMLASEYLAGGDSADED